MTMFTDLSLHVAQVGEEVRAVAKFTISLYRSPIASDKFTDLSLQITPYKDDGKKIMTM
jgi:hypothetical protein